MAGFLDGGDSSQADATTNADEPAADGEPKKTLRFDQAPEQEEDEDDEDKEDQEALIIQEKA